MEVATAGNRVPMLTDSAMIFATGTRAVYTMSLPSSCDIELDSCVRATRAARCGRATSHRSSYTFRPRGVVDGVTKCLRCALRHWPMLRRSLIASVVVGTALTALNQGDAIVSGQIAAALAWKIPLTYCVPFLVATYGALSNSRN